MNGQRKFAVIVFSLLYASVYPFPQVSQLLELAFTGFPLKTEHMSYGENNELTSKATFEITEIAEKDLNPELFKVPDGYTEKEMEVETQGEDGETQKKKFKLGDMFK